MPVNLKKRFHLIDIIRGRCTWAEYIDGRDDLTPEYRAELKRYYGIA